jgi:hypothetical protein
MDLFLWLALGMALLWLVLLLRVNLDSLTATFTTQIGWTAQKNIVGSDYSPNSNASTIKKTLTVGTSIANASAGGGDELYSFVTSLAGAASASIDLTAFADILNQSAALLARAKVIIIRVLSVADDAVIGTAATGVLVDATVANALVSQSGSGWFKAVTSTFDIPNGGVLAFGTPAAAGVLVDGTHKVIKVTNNDGAVTLKCQITVVGGST